MRKILAIDGGGIRGLIPSVILASIEQRTGKPIASLFDLIAGTSTGGIIALALACPDPAIRTQPLFSAAKVRDLYLENGSRIFPRSLWRFVTNTLANELYPNSGIEGFLKEQFGDATLGSLLVDVAIPSYDIERRKPKVFTRSDSEDKVWAVARATSAAPTYFEPARIEREGRRTYEALIDGGVYANNPSAYAVVKAKCIWPEEDDFAILSLGTGSMTRPIHYDEAINWGKIGWLTPILHIALSASADAAHDQIQALFPTGRYLRLNRELSLGNDDIDDVSKANLEALKLTAEQILADHDRQLDSFCRLVTENQHAPI
jgi:hypothetical protein